MRFKLFARAAYVGDPELDDRDDVLVPDLCRQLFERRLRREKQNHYYSDCRGKAAQTPPDHAAQQICQYGRDLRGDAVLRVSVLERPERENCYGDEAHREEPW